MPNPEPPIPYDNLCKRDKLHIWATTDTVIVSHDEHMKEIPILEGFGIDAEFILPFDDERASVFIYVEEDNPHIPFVGDDSGYWLIKIADWNMMVQVPVRMPGD